MNIDDLLIKPNIDPFDSNTQRIRRNLVIASLLAIVLTSGSASFDANQTGLLGVKLEHINMVHFYYLLLAALVYFSIHFIWAAFDNLKENKLRLTGIKVPSATVSSYMASPTFEPNTSESRQSTLFSWWQGHRNLIEHLEKNVQRIEENVSNNNLEAAINSSKQMLEEINSKVSYINIALLKFEHGYWQYQRSQILRWLLLDFGMPFLLSVVAIVSVIFVIS